ncbi:pyrimidine dimer DNA glycosylase/endonuclease V [Streptomyces sp. NBC_00691]
MLRGLTGPGHGWRRHPAVPMWARCEEALVRYGLEICGVWITEGHAGT